MATYQDGGVRRATANTVTAMQRSAERRRCSVCGRKSALVSEYEGIDGGYLFVTVCRWQEAGKCDREPTTEVIKFGGG